MHFVDLERDCSINGATTYLALLAQGLTERGHDYTYASRDGAFRDGLRQAGARVLKTAPWPVNIPQVAWHVWRRPADVYLCAGRGRSRYTALYLARTRRRPCICILHDPMMAGQTREEMLRPSVLVTFEAPIREACLQLGVPAERVRLWPRPVRTHPLGAPGPGFEVLHLGRLADGKARSAMALVAGVEELLGAIPDLHITIAGGGEDSARVAAQAAAVNAQAGRTVVQAVGQVLDPLTWIERAHVVVAGGYSCLEALVNGRPAVASGFQWLGPITADNCGPAAALHFGDRATEPHSVPAMAQAIRTVHDSLRAAPGESPYLPRGSWLPEDHSVAHTAQLMEDLARELTLPLRRG